MLLNAVKCLGHSFYHFGVIKGKPTGVERGGGVKLPPTQVRVNIFCTVFKLKNLVKELTYYKNTEIPSCIDLFLTSCVRRLRNKCVFEIGLFNFQKIVLTIPRWKVEPLLPKIIRYRTYKQFDEEKFKIAFQNYLSKVNSSDLSGDIFKMLFLNALNKFAFVRTKITLCDHLRFVNKDFSKALMCRTKLCNKFHKEKTM